MRAGRPIRRGGFDHFAVIMILIAYCFVGGLGGFGPAAGGHAPQEMVHLPGASRILAFTSDMQAGHRSTGEDGLHTAAVFRPGIDEAASATPPLGSKNPAAAAHEFTQLAQFVVSVLTGGSESELPAETRTVAAADPAWWLRTVVLHL